MWRQLRYYGGFYIRGKLRHNVRSFLQAADHCQEVQAATLQRILQLNADSDYSRQRGLSPSLSVDQFRRRMEISDFETIRNQIEQLKAGNKSSLLGSKNQLLMFALSSGTTSESKFIPITKQFLKDYRRGWNLWGINAFDAHPALHFSDILQLSSDYDQFRTEGGIPCGNISGLVNKVQSPIIRMVYAVPYAVSKIKDSEAKLYTALRLSIPNKQIGLVMTANPSTLVQIAKLADQNKEELIRDIALGTLSSRLNISPETRAALHHRIRRPDPIRAKQLDRIASLTGELRPVDFWPRLTMAAVWTGGSASAYLDTMRRYYGNVTVRDHGLSASEGRMTIPFVDASSLGMLDINSHFFEFIPADEYDSPNRTVLQAHELEEGGSYYILLTTVSGLYRYDIRDVVRCRGFQGTTPLLEFLHKGSSISNLTGEKLTEFQVVSAVTNGVREAGIELDFYTLSPVWGDPPRYRLHVEDSMPLNRISLNRIAQGIDHQLQQLNSEYQEKRNSSRLAPLEFHILPPGTWRRFAGERQSRRGGSVEQYKHPCLVPSLEFSDHLVREFARPAAQRRDKVA